MKNKWRLVNYDELYDLRSDLNQQNNIAADHPDIVEELRAAYEAWWEKCSRQAELENPFCVGAQAGEVSRLDCMDLRNETGYTVWNQKQVRNAESCLGFWDINVEQDGLYEFELRRWPEEAGHGIGQAINPEDDIEFAAEYISQREQGYYCGSKAMNVEWAQLKISGQPELCQPVEAELSAAVFQVQLSKGNYRLRANFYDRKLSEFSSVYYLYIKLL